MAKRKIDPRMKKLVSFDWISDNHDRVFIDTSVIHGNVSFNGVRSGGAHESGNIRVVSSAIKRGYKLLVIPKVRDEFLDERVYFHYMNMERGGERLWKERTDFIHLIEENGLLYDVSLDSKTYAGPLDNIDHSRYRELRGADVPLSNAGYLSSLEMSTAVITNDSAIIDTWKNTMRNKCTERIPNEYRMFSRRTQKGECEKMKY